MELDVILDGIRKKEHQEIKRIESEAENQISQIQKKTIQEADIQKNRILSDGRIKLNRDKALIAQQAEMQALKTHADARQVLIENVLNKVKDRFCEIRARKDYPRILENLIDETVRAILPSLFEDGRIFLHLDKKDLEIAKRIIRNFDKSIELVDDLRINGGCIAETDDQMVTVKNTLDSRFFHAEDKIWQDLSLFFEEKASAS